MDANVNANAVGLPAGEFEKIFLKAYVLTDALSNAKSAKSKATKIGNFLTSKVGREVPINVNGRTGKATLCMRQGRARQKVYFFEVLWDSPNTDAEVITTQTNTPLDDGVDAPAAGEATADDAARGDATVSQHDSEGSGNAEAW